MGGNGGHGFNSSYHPSFENCDMLFKLFSDQSQEEPSGRKRPLAVIPRTMTGLVKQSSCTEKLKASDLFVANKFVYSNFSIKTNICFAT